MLAHIASRFSNSRTRARYGFAVCLGLSLLLHALLIFAPARQQTENSTAPAKVSQMPLTVHLRQSAPPVAMVPPAATPPSVHVSKRKAAPRALPALVLSKPAPPIPAAPEAPPAPPVAAAPPQPASEPPLDMMAMLEAKRAQRRAAMQHAEAGAPADAHEPSANDVALANIKRSLQGQPGGSSGPGGVFQIVSKGTRTGQFVFRGWLAGSRNNWRQTIDVDAGLNGDVDRAIVRRMIELIRSHYPGDFNWESHRLGRVIVLSARPADNADLEAFLMREFFGA